MPSFSENTTARKYLERPGQVIIYLGKLFRICIHEHSWKVLPMAAVVAFIVASVCENVFVNMEGTEVGALAFACVCIWNGFFNSIQSICKERPIIKREHRAGMHISSYMIANMIYQAVLCFLQTIIQIYIYRLCGIKYPTYGLITGSFVIDFGITLFLISYSADMLALMVSCIVKSTTVAMTVVPFLLIIQLIFSGVAFQLNGVTDQISQATISRWGIRTICTVADHNSMPSVTLQAAFNKLTAIPEVKAVAKYIYTSEVWDIIGNASQESRVSDEYAFTVENIRNEWLVMGSLSIVFAAVGTVFLEFIDRDRR